MATRETTPSPWPQTSGGLYMRADASEAGRLARLADVVLWLIETQGLPRVPAVHRMADQLEAANPAPELFTAQPGNYARPLEGDAARFAYETEASWNYTQMREQARENNARYRREHGIPFDGWLGEITPEQAQKLKAAAAAGKRPSCYRAPPAGLLVEPGIPALLRRMRESWVKNWPKVASDAEFFQHRHVSALGIALRLGDAARIWGYGADWLPATVTEPTTFAELVAAVRGRRKGTPWSETEKALLRAEFQQRNGWRQIGSTWSRDSGVQTALAKELDLSARTALGRHLGNGPDAGATVAASWAGALISKR